MTDAALVKLADELEKLCCAETEGKFFDLVSESMPTILAGLRRAAQQDGVWQPIATAPKDGTPIEACNTRHPSHAPVIVRWLDELANPDTGWCDAATPSGDALYYNKNYFDLWKPCTPVPQKSGAEQGQK